MPNANKVSFHTLGCRLNISESESLEGEFKKRGFSIVDFSDSADYVVINTCTVTNSADSNCRNIIRKAHKNNPEAKIIVIGCYAQLAPDEVKAIEGVDLVLGTNEKFKIFEYLELQTREKNIYVDASNEFHGAMSGAEGSHTRAFLKIQDGCNYYCAYCIIPFARGNPRSISIVEAKHSLETLIQNGFSEVVLTGVNVGLYCDKQNQTLIDLLRELMTTNIQRLRLSSIEPNIFSEELIDLIKNDSRIMNHLHIPLQSGSASILSKMKRRYTLVDYQQLINKLVNAIPLLSIGTDVIVGFPGESEAEFNETYNFLDNLPLTHLHVFPYSPRKGTVAGSFEGQVHGDVKKARVQKLIELGERKKQLFMQKMLNQNFSVLFEEGSDGFYPEYTSNYLPVKLHSDQNLKNKILNVTITDIKDQTLIAKALPS